MTVVEVEGVDREVVVEIETETVGVVVAVVDVMIVVVAVEVDLIETGGVVVEEVVVEGIDREDMEVVVVMVGVELVMVGAEVVMVEVVVAMVEVVVVAAVAVVMVVIEDITRETKVVVLEDAVVDMVEVEVVEAITKVGVAVTTDLVAATIKVLVEAVVECRVTTHKVVLGIIKAAGVIRLKVSKVSKPGVNKAGEARDSNRAGELRAMDSGVMVNNHREAIHHKQLRLTMLQHGEHTILAPGLTGASSIISNINNGMVSRLLVSMHRLVPLQAQLPQQLQVVPAVVEHLKLLETNRFTVTGNPCLYDKLV